jgi:hypothetical protein
MASLEYEIPPLGVCSLDSDNMFGPRVDIACRPFDFSLLFEDAIFVATPAAVFLLIFPFRLRTLWKAPNKAQTQGTVICKLVRNPAETEIGVVISLISQQL